jgi:formylmethanofuran dehydrogenase subunit E
MAVTSIRTTEYSVQCDKCGTLEVAHSGYEDVYSKQQAIKWAGMHKLKNGKILCDKCYNEYKKGNCNGT